MQNQRNGKVSGNVFYTSYWDCFKTVGRLEGARGFYRGLAPQLVGGKHPVIDARHIERPILLSSW